MSKKVVGLGLAIVLIVFVAVLFFYQGKDPDSSSNRLMENATAQDPNSVSNVIGDGTLVENQPETHAIDIENYDYSPSGLTINVGDTIIWTNKDGMSHTVTSDSGTELNSPLFSRNQEYSHTFTETGTFDYHCKPHPYMKGRVVVQ